MCAVCAHERNFFCLKFNPTILKAVQLTRRLTNRTRQAGKGEVEDVYARVMLADDTLERKLTASREAVQDKTIMKRRPIQRIDH